MIVRVTGVLIKKSHILLLEQNAHNDRGWSLPGGTVEEGESLEQALLREMLEETGLKINIEKLLYICDFIKDGKHVIHISFLVNEIGGKLGAITEGLDTQEIKSVQFLPIHELESKGFSRKFQTLAEQDFPNAGNYMGNKSNIGL